MQYDVFKPFYSSSSENGGNVTDVISEVESLAVSTQEMAQNGSRSMESLIAHSVETSQITATVNKKVDKLIEHSMQIGDQEVV